MDGAYLVTDASPFDYLPTSSACLGSFTKINIRMDSTVSGNGSLGITGIQILP
jgi:hypothetical protein